MPDPPVTAAQTDQQRLRALEKLAAAVAADVKHRDNYLPTVIGRVQALLAGLRAEAGEEQSEDGDIVNRVTAVVRTADRDFERVGGSSRHWVRDCFLPTLNAAGLTVRVEQAATDTARIADHSALVARLTAAQSQALDARDKAGRDGDSQTLAYFDGIAEGYERCLAALADAPVPPAVQYYENVWIVTEFDRGGIRGVFTSQADAEGAIASIRSEHPDLERSDFVIEVHRIRRAVPPATKGACERCHGSGFEADGVFVCAWCHGHGDA